MYTKHMANGLHIQYIYFNESFLDMTEITLGMGATFKATVRMVH